MMLLRAPDFGRRQKVATFVCVGVVESLVAYIVARGRDVIPDEPLAIPPSS